MRINYLIVSIQVLEKKTPNLRDYHWYRDYMYKIDVHESYYMGGILIDSQYVTKNLYDFLSYEKSMKDIHRQLILIDMDRRTIIKNYITHLSTYKQR